MLHSKKLWRYLYGRAPAAQWVKQWPVKVAVWDETRSTGAGFFSTVNEVVVCSILLTTFSPHFSGTYPWPQYEASCARPF